MTLPAVWHYGRWDPSAGRLRLFHQTSNHAERIGVSGDGQGQGLLVDPAFSPGSLTAWERAVFYMPGDILDSNPLVIRSNGSPEDAVHFTGGAVESAVDFIEKRTGGRPTVLVLEPVSSDSGFGSMRVRSLTNGSYDERILIDLQALELEAQLSWSGAVMTSDRAHFELPAGTHADKFIRVADALANVAYPAKLADWLQEYVVEGTALIADTAGLLPLVRELRTRAHRQFQWDIPIEVFPSYPEVAEIRRLLSSAQSRVSNAPEPRVLFLLSVASSKALLQNVEAMADDVLPQGFDRKVLTLVATNPPDGPVTVPGAMLHIPVRRYEVPAREICEICREGRQGAIIKIDRAKYFPFVEGTFASRMLDSKSAQAHVDLWEAASDTDAIRVHVQADSTAGKRHLEIQFDLQRLLTSEAFERRAMSALHRAVPLCDVAIIPGHGSYAALAELVRKSYPTASVFDVAPEGAGEWRREVVECLQQSQQILILDDAIVHGHTIRALHRSVQRILTEESREDYEVHGFALLARPQSHDSWSRLQNAFLQSANRSNLHACDILAVPNRQDRCPWCLEEQLLQRLQTKLAQPEMVRLLVERSALEEEQLTRMKQLIQQRLDMLQSGRGLSGSLFFAQSRDGAVAVDPDADPHRLSPHSLFGDRLKEAAVYAAVSTAMQEIRTAPALERNKMVWQTDKILTAYHDPLLSAAFLRSALPEELVTLDDGRSFREALSEISFASGDGNPNFQQDPLLASEVQFAVETAKLPTIFRSLVRERIHPILQHCSDPVLETLDLIGWLMHGTTPS